MVTYRLKFESGDLHTIVVGATTKYPTHLHKHHEHVLPITYIFPNATNLYDTIITLIAEYTQVN